MAARKGPSFQLSNEHRLKIANSNILKYLIQHVGGTREMSQTQVTAAIALLKKVMPDLATTTIAGDPENPVTVAGEIRLIGVRPGAKDA